MADRPIISREADEADQAAAGEWLEKIRECASYEKALQAVAGDAEGALAALMCARSESRVLRATNEAQTYAIRVLADRLRAAGQDGVLGEVLHLPEEAIARVIAAANKGR